MINMTNLKTPLLNLRTLTDDDIAIVRHLRKDWFDTDEEALEWSRWANDKTDEMNPHTFFVWLTQTNQLIGSVHFYAKPDLDYEVEYWKKPKEHTNEPLHHTPKLQVNPNNIPNPKRNRAP